MYVGKVDGVEFEIKPSQTILEAAISSGITLPYGCRSGSCGSCKATIIEGEVFHEDIMPGVLTDQDRSEQNFLLCKTYATSDVTITSPVEKKLDEFPKKITPVRVEKLSLLNHDVMQILLKLPAGENLQFKAGQYLEFILKDGARRAFSMANAPSDDLIELHVRLIEGGTFTNYVFNEMKEKSIHRIEAPIGNFYLRESDRPMIFVAGGTGFAPIKSIINDCHRAGVERKIYLYRGFKTHKDLYQDEVVENWKKNINNFEAINIYSEEVVNGQEKSLVHKEVIKDLGQLDSFDVYCCGAPGMIEVAYKEFVEAGLNPNSFYSDAFTFAPK
jgi:CDP-4-dehydro-6-deoxyglucose reductase